jgi:hypothetical protein
MQLDLIPKDTRVILNLPAGGIESVADGDQDIVVRSPAL